MDAALLRVLIVDDDDAKAESVETLLREIVPSVRVVRAKNAAEAIGVAYGSDVFDIMIVDLLLPARQGADPQPGGGLEMLKTLANGRGASSAQHVVALTAHPDLADGQHKLLAQEAVSVFRYGGASPWEEDLTRLVVRVLETRERASEGYGLDVLFLTALHNIELDAVLELELGWKEELLSPGRFFGTISGSTRALTCVAMACPEMGMPIAAAVAMDAIHSLRPRILLFTGIAAGVANDVSFGDVLVGESLWDYGAGKAFRRGARSAFAPAGSQRRSDDLLLTRARGVARSSWAIDTRLAWGDRGAAPKNVPRVVVGPIASGAAVVADASLVERVRAVQRKVVGLDMEGYGVIAASNLASGARPRTLVCKSVCDFADARKDDAYQRYAAFTSARFGLEVVRKYGC